MKTQTLQLRVSPSIGNVSAECFAPEKSTCIMTLAHGAGAGMDHSFMIALSTALAAAGIATLRFNFPFAEQKKFRPDSPEVAHQVIQAAINKAQELFPLLPLFTAGKSFGGRMTSQHVAIAYQPEVKGIIFYGFPLHPSGKPSIERATHLNEVQAPMLFLQGTKDALASWDLIESVCSSLPKATLVKIDGADHTFKAGKQNTVQLLADATRDWIEKITRDDKKKKTRS